MVLQLGGKNIFSKNQNFDQWSWEDFKELHAIGGDMMYNFPIFEKERRVMTVGMSTLLQEFISKYQTVLDDAIMAIKKFFRLLNILMELPSTTITQRKATKSPLRDHI